MANKKNKQKSGEALPRTARRSAPAFLDPMAAQLVKQLPVGEDWIYEVKLDGYRALLIKDGQRVKIRSRRDKDLTQMYPGVAEAALRAHAARAVIDGEIVAVNTSLGLPSRRVTLSPARARDQP